MIGTASGTIIKLFTMISADEIEQSGGKGLITLHKGSFAKVLTSTFPKHDWQVDVIFAFFTQRCGDLVLFLEVFGKTKVFISKSLLISSKSTEVLRCYCKKIEYYKLGAMVQCF